MISYRRSLKLPAILLLLALPLLNCAGSMGSLQVNLQALKECQKFAGPVKVKPIADDTDYRDLSADAGGAIAQANRKDAARTRCENKVISDYRKGAP